MHPVCGMRPTLAHLAEPTAIPYGPVPFAPHAPALMPDRPPLVRIVRMTFHPGAVDDFIAHFDEVSPHIRAFPGCLHLELWRDARYPNICTTYSHWDSKDALNDYRHSDLFADAWREAKSKFAARPIAQSYTPMRTVDE